MSTIEGFNMRPMMKGMKSMLTNNLVLFDQQDKVARPESIKPDLATEWSGSADNKVLTMKLREGVK